MKYKKINNSGLGICHVICENEKGYLIYSEKNIQHFIVTLEIINNSFYYNEYFSSLENALNYFNDLEGDDD